MNKYERHIIRIVKITVLSLLIFFPHYNYAESDEIKLWGGARVCCTSLLFEGSYFLLGSAEMQVQKGNRRFSAGLKGIFPRNAGIKGIYVETDIYSRYIFKKLRVSLPVNLLAVYEMNGFSSKGGFINLGILLRYNIHEKVQIGLEPGYLGIGRIENRQEDINYNIYRREGFLISLYYNFKTF